MSPEVIFRVMIPGRMSRVLNDTIAAISTSPVSAAIGLIRLSGPASLPIASSFLFKEKTNLGEEYFTSQVRKAITCEFVKDNQFLDKAVCTYFKSPDSYTGEDIVEISLHGNQILLREVLKALFSAGARPAERGEFTKRAFLNNKMELSEAEAIARMISARSEFELNLARRNMTGDFSRLVSRIRSSLLSIKAECEAEIDFAGEDLTYDTLDARKTNAENLAKLCKDVLSRAEATGKILKNTSVVIYGEPNTGKSSLMNKLLGKERAIVSEVPGTTRDFISEVHSLGNIPIRLVDTAGVRDTSDKIESAGIEMSEREFASATVKIFLTAPADISEFEKLVNCNREKIETSLLVLNKSDLWTPTEEELKSIPWLKEVHICKISCMNGDGLKSLEEQIVKMIETQDMSEDSIFLEDRYIFGMQRILDSLNQFSHLINTGAPLDIAVVEIDICLEEIGKLTGRVDTEEVLGRVFSMFCVGK